MRAVGLNYAGVLAAQAIEAMEELLVQELGQQSGHQDGWALLRYCRQVLCRKVSSPMCQPGDPHLLHVGRPASEGSHPNCPGYSRTPAKGVFHPNNSNSSSNNNNNKVSRTGGRLCTDHLRTQPGSFARTDLDHLRTQIWIICAHRAHGVG